MSDWPKTIMMKQFGVDLKQVMMRPTEHVIPTILKEMVPFLYQCIGIIGIFRITPSNESLREAFSKVNDRPSDFGFETIDPHIVAGLFKKYLEDLPTGVIPSRLYPQFLATRGDLDELKQIIQTELPPINKRLLEIICILLFMVGEKADTNQMSTRELAVIFAPLVLRLSYKRDTCNQAVEDMMAIFVFQLMIENQAFLFSTRPKDMTLVKSYPPPNLVACRKRISEMESHLKICGPALENHLKILKKQLEAMDYSVGDIDLLKKALENAKIEFAKYLWIAKEVEKKTYVPHQLKCVTRIKSGEYGTIGRRNTMEDEVILFDDLNKESALLPPNINRSMYAVYDGHAGSEVSGCAKEHLHKNIIRYLIACPSTDSKFVFDAMRKGIVKTDNLVAATPELKSGSTVVLVYIQDETLYVANLGDSEALMGRKQPGTETKYTPILLSHKHKPDEEEENARLLTLGARVEKGRVFGGLAVSRALGDSAYKKPYAPHDYVSNDPYVASFPLSPADTFLVIACDGLWDCVTYQMAVDITAEEYGKGTEPAVVARILAEKSYDLNSHDNISVIVVYFYWKNLPN